MNNRAFTIVFITVFIDLLGFGLVVPILSVYVKEIGASDMQVGLLASIFALTSFFFTPFLGSLSDRIGRRPIILFGIAMNIIGYLIFSQAFIIPILILSRILNGLGSSNISAAQAYVADISSPESRTKYMGMLGAAFGLGFIFGPAFGGLIKAQFGFSYVGYTAAALCALNFISAYFLLPESLKEKNTSSPVRIFPAVDFFEAVKNPLLASFFTLMFVYVFAFSLMQTIIAVLWKEEFAQDDNHVGYLFTIIGVFSALVQGVLVSRLIKTIGEQKMLLLGIILLALGFFFIPFVPKAHFFICTVVDIGFISTGSGLLGPSIMAMVSKSADGHIQGKVLGLNQAVSSVSRIAGPIFSGVLYHFNHAIPFLSAAVFMFLSLFVATNALKQYGQFTNPPVLESADDFAGELQK